MHCWCAWTRVYCACVDSPVCCIILHPAGRLTARVLAVLAVVSRRQLLTLRRPHRHTHTRAAAPIVRRYSRRPLYSARRLGIGLMSFLSVRPFVCLSLLSADS